MKHFKITLFLVFFANVLLAQPPVSWYKVMTGKIGQIDATLHLHAGGDKWTGYLWFNNTPMIMQCYADYKAGNDSLFISANANPLTVVLSGKLTGNIFEGAASLEKENSAAKHAVFKLQTTSDTLFTAFDYVYTTGNALMPAKLKNESTASYYSAVVWPKAVNNKSLDATLKMVIGKAINNKGTVKEPGATLVVEKNKFIAEWNKMAALLKPAEAKDMGLSYSSELQKNMLVMYEDSRVITLADFGYEYSGGAHGNYSTSITGIDKRSGKVLVLSDVLTPEGIQMLPRILDAVARQQYGFDKTKTLEQNGLFVKTIMPSKNFYITNGSLGFYYTTYEIMAFAYGEPNLFIPASAIEKYIKPAYKKIAAAQ